MARINLVDMAQESIREMIANKAYDENGFLPSEGDMAKQMDVSRATIREAVRSMEMRGFVKRIHGRGVKVLDDSVGVITRSLEDLLGKNENAQDDLLEVRMMLEPNGAALAAKRRTDEDIALLKNNISAMEACVSMNTTYHNADLAFHLELAKITNNQIYISYMSANISVLNEQIATSLKSDCSFEQTHHYHRNIFEAVKNGDEKAAYDAMMVHLKATERNRNRQKQST